MWDVILDTLLDTVKLIPFLLITYIINDSVLKQRYFGDYNVDIP